MGRTALFLVGLVLIGLVVFFLFNPFAKSEKTVLKKSSEAFKRVNIKKSTDPYTYDITFCQNKATGTEMSLREAIEIAKKGECRAKGDFKPAYSEHMVSYVTDCDNTSDSVVWSIGSTSGYTL